MFCLIYPANSGIRRAYNFVLHRIFYLCIRPTFQGGCNNIGWLCERFSKNYTQDNPCKYTDNNHEAIVKTFVSFIQAFLLLYGPNWIDYMNCLKGSIIDSGRQYRLLISLLGIL